MSRYPFLRIFIVLLSCCSFRVQSLALPVEIKHEVRQNAPASMASCVLNGNSDLYGLGIRLGVYFQLISTLLANHFLADALREAWDANTIFLLSIFIAIIKSSVSVDNLTAPEAFVLLQMLFAFLIAVYHIGPSLKWYLFDFLTRILKGTMERDLDWWEIASELGRAQVDVSNLGTTMRQFLALAITSYNVWFWFSGSDLLDSGRHCSSEIFVFARVDLHGDATIFFQVWGIIYLLYQVHQCSWSIGPTSYFVAVWMWRASNRYITDFNEPKPNWHDYMRGLLDPISQVEKDKAKAVKEEKPKRSVIDNHSLI
jgi:hypothetical protein